MSSNQDIPSTAAPAAPAVTDGPVPLSPINLWLVTEQDGAHHVVHKHSLASELARDAQYPCKVEPLQTMSEAATAIAAWRTMRTNFSGGVDRGDWIDGAPSDEMLLDLRANAPSIGLEFAYAASQAQQPTAPQAGAPAARWPKDASEVRQFMHANCEVEEYFIDEKTPHENDRFQLTAHDFLEAINWWADFPHHNATQPQAGAESYPPSVARVIELGERVAFEAAQAVKQFCEGEPLTATPESAHHLKAEFVAAVHELADATAALRARGAVPSDPEILSTWDAFVGQPTVKLPLTNADKVAFARAVLSRWGAVHS